MGTVSGHLSNQPFDLSRLDGITDPTKFNAELHRTIRENLQSGGFLPPTEGITTPVEDAEDTGSFFQNTVNKITNYAGVKAFDTNADKYEQRRFDFITAEEGYREGVYRDSLKRRTIGYGFNLDDPSNIAMAQRILQMTPKQVQAIRDGKQNITERQARMLFEASVGAAERLVQDKFEGTPLRSHQRLALVSLAYNHPNLLGPNLTKAVRNGDLAGAVTEIRERSNKFKIAGIDARRQREAALFTGYMNDNEIKQDGGTMLASMFGVSTANAATIDAPKSKQEATKTAEVDTFDDPESWAATQVARPVEEDTSVKLGGVTVKDASGSAVKGGDDFLTKYVPAHVRMFIKDVVGDQDALNTETLSAKFFSKPELEAILTVVGRSYQRSGGGTKGSVQYTGDKKNPDYRTGVQDVSFSGSNLNLVGVDAEATVKKTLGQFSWEINKRGELIITDRYNFNDAQKYQDMYPTQWAKVLHLTALAGKAATSSEIGLYGVIRRAAAFYGSKEGQGASFKINLGKVNLRKLRAQQAVNVASK